MADEQPLEEQEVRVPPYFERFLEERDKRFSNEIARLESEMRHNGQRIDELRAAITRLDSKIDSHFRWMLGLLSPIILGVVALLIQNLLQ